MMKINRKSGLAFSLATASPMHRFPGPLVNTIVGADPETAATMEAGEALAAEGQRRQSAGT